MLKTKIIFLLFFLILCVSIYFYYTLDKSYVLSTEAKKYYKSGDYKEAYELAKKAYDENSYNRMAFTLVVHSKKSIEWEKYIKETEKYLKFIDELSYKESISKSDRSRIKMICDISIENYTKLKKDAMLIDPSLKDRAERLHERILAINKKLFN